VQPSSTQMRFSTPKNSGVSFLLAAVLGLAASSALAGTTLNVDQVARERGEGPRGEGGGHSSIEQREQTVARGADDAAEDLGDDHGGLTVARGDTPEDLSGLPG
jgi:hypothetical protein